VAVLVDGGLAIACCRLPPSLGFQVRLARLAASMPCAESSVVL